MPDPLEVEIQLQGEETMDENIKQLMSQRLMQVGTASHENMTKVIHYTDTDYLEGRRVIGLSEAVGVREVQAKESPGGPANANRTQ